MTTKGRLYAFGRSWRVDTRRRSR